MPTTNDSALVLAGQLRESSDAALVELLDSREIRQAGIRDFFDLAEALLDPASIQHALGRLDRPTLAALAAVSELVAPTEEQVAGHLNSLGAHSTATAAHLAEAQRLALLTRSRATFTVPQSVATQLREWPGIGLPSVAELISSPAPAALAPVSAVSSRLTDQVASEHAFATTSSVAELLWALNHDSARALARGGIALPDSKRLAAAMRVDREQVAELLEICERAGLVEITAGRWRAAGPSADWLIASSPERWARLAGAWLDRLPHDVRAMLAVRSHAAWGEHIEGFLQWYFPAGGEWMTERVRVYTRDAELLGVTAMHVPSSAGVALLAHGTEAATEVIAAMFPTEAHKVYLQHDLTIVSTGPLAPDLDARLRGIADVEGRALASSYRVSTASLYRAMAAGETAESIGLFLSEIALTGIPQPLHYVVTEATARYGLVRVGAVDASRSYVRSSDETIIRTLLVDHAVAPLGLTRVGDRLETAVELGIALWTLSDARYPVAAENSAGAVISLQRRHAAVSTVASDADAAAALIERLRLGGSADPDVTGKAWLSRQLDAAIRAKAALTVTVQLPDGSAVEYELEPASVAGGRLRARDRHSDIERTLPLSSITAVAPAL